MITNGIPEEYDTMDFGFSAVDDYQPENQEQQSNLMDLLQSIDNKLDMLLNVESGEDPTVTSEKVQRVEKLIMPLLVNLLKTPERAYIHWPNRGDQIQDTIDKLLAITRGS